MSVYSTMTGEIALAKIEFASRAEIETALCREFGEFLGEGDIMVQRLRFVYAESVNCACNYESGLF